MNRSTAREIAIQLCFAGANGKLSADELLDSFFAEEHYASLAAEDELYSEYPDDKQMDYTKGCIDRELQRILGDAAQPWEERYPKEVFG